MATLDFKYGLLMGLDIHRMLRLIDGSRRLYDNTEQEGHARCKASQDTAIAVCRRNDLIPFDCHRIIGLRAPHSGKGKSIPKFYAFNGRYGKEQLAQRAFYRIEIGFPEPHGKMESHTFDDAANGILVLLGGTDDAFHDRTHLIIKVAR